MGTSTSDRVWEEMDELVAARIDSNPWTGATPPERSFTPDYHLLRELLDVPLKWRASTASGLPAKAVDVWMASELRRAGFGADDDEVWPRATYPRVLPTETQSLIDQLPGNLRTMLLKRLSAGQIGGGAASADANILGKAYVKQVDVVMSTISRGPELLISTKRMDSSFSKNALNRIEESYGDIKNLRARHPLAATGYLMVVRSTLFQEKASVAERLMDLLASLAREDDAYDATGLIVMEWQDVPADRGVPTDHLLAVLQDRVPGELDMPQFLGKMVRTVLNRTPIDIHVVARERLLGKELAVASDE